jgi:hypothetical protein
MMEDGKYRSDKRQCGNPYHPAVHVLSSQGQRILDFLIAPIVKRNVAFSRTFRSFGRGNQLFQVRQYFFHLILQFPHPLRQRKVAIPGNNFLVNSGYLFFVRTFRYTIYAPFGHLLISLQAINFPLPTTKNPAPLDQRLTASVLHQTTVATCPVPLHNLLLVASVFSSLTSRPPGATPAFPA